MTLPRRAFLASLLAVPFVPKFSLPKVDPTFVYSDPVGAIAITFFNAPACGWYAVTTTDTTNMVVTDIATGQILERGKDYEVQAHTTRTNG